MMFQCYKITICDDEGKKKNKIIQKPKNQKPKKKTKKKKSCQKKSQNQKIKSIIPNLKTRTI